MILLIFLKKILIFSADSKERMKWECAKFR
jgi:hypothetical protein